MSGNRHLCSHEKSELRKKGAWRQGPPMVQRQCDECLRGLGDAVPLDAFPEEQRFRFKFWLTEKKPNSKRQKYDAYMKSPAWKAKRLLVLERDGWVCRMLRGAHQRIPPIECRMPATQVHHLTYDRFENELLEDLIAVCPQCNARERKERISGFVS